MVLVTDADFLASRQFYIALPFDPQVVPVSAPRGTRYVQLGSGRQFWKLDNGETTSWIEDTGGGGGGGGGIVSRVIVLTPAQVAARQIVLIENVMNPSDMTIWPKSGTPFFPVDDFIAVGNVISWAGRGIEPLAQAGDKWCLLYRTGA